MKAKLINGKWYIEVYTEELGYVLLLEDSYIPRAREFDSEEDVNNYIKENTH